MIEITLAQNDGHLAGILSLQSQNTPESLTEKEWQAEGFVTVVHTMPLLRAMHREAPSIIALDAGRVVGYCLAMTTAMRDAVPVLRPMFSLIDGLAHRQDKLADTPYIVSGQVCVAKPYRGQRVFDRMYAHYRACYAGHYACILTEIATRNPRSLRAHARVGFEVLHQYVADNGEAWAIVIWPWDTHPNHAQ